MQGAQPKRFIPLAVIAGCLCWSSHLSGLKFVPIYEPLTIKAQKNSPPHVAFEELLESEQPFREWANFEKIKPLALTIEKTNQSPLFAKKIELTEMVLKKNVERIPLESFPEQVVAVDSSEWMNELPRSQSVRLQEAQRRSEVLGQDWSGPSWSDTAKEVLEKSGALVTGSSVSNSKVYVAARDPMGTTRTEVPKSSVQFPARGEEHGFLPSSTLVEKSRGQSVIVGPIEITGGLAVTNEHHIEVRRSDEGVLKELGRVDLMQGLYNIEVEETTGTLVARLVDKDGKTLGEGSFRLSRLVASAAKSLQGPKLKIEPHPSFAGVVASLYNPRPTDAAPAQTRATFIKGASEVLATKEGLVAMDNVAKGSTTVMRVAAPKHMQTASIVVSGDEFRTSLYPEPMINALQEIVAQQRSQFYDGAPTVVWGRASLDGKSIAGIDVIVESEPDLQPIYFNQLMLPDASLKSTSDNGLYAFVNVSRGFHSLLATRANSIFGYQNVVVEEGSVAQGDVVSTIKTETVPLRIYDAFSGEGVSSSVTMQSLDADLEVKSGVATVSLPGVSRLGMMRVQPEGTEYVAARYFYNDSDEFIHAPLVHRSWLSSIKTYLRIDDHPRAGFVVGFVPDEDFEVYLAAYDNFEARQIVYFDMQGRILQNRKGMAGGGFILYNVPEDAHEVVVVGQRTQKIYSRVLPVDSDSLSVLTFREVN